MKFLIAGPQGSGKTTQARIIAHHYNLCLVDSGDMIRQLATEDSAEGRQVARALAAGRLISNKIAARLVEDRVKQDDCQNGYVFDGYPRSLAQIKWFNPKFDHVFYLKINDQLVEERMKLRNRSDDTPELMRKRLAIFHKRTKPVLDYYRKQNILTEVDGHLGVPAVSQQILSFLPQI